MLAKNGLLQLSPTYIFSPRKLPEENNSGYDFFILLFDS